MAVIQDELRQRLLETAQLVNERGILSFSGHGNLSLRVPGRDEMLYVGGLQALDGDSVARIRLDGQVLEGEVPPMGQAVIGMHTAVYQDVEEAQCVLHTHSPFATAFAVAGRPLPCWTEAMAIFGLGDGVPVAAYGPRGSELAVAHIRAALSARPGAVLLANHGVLAFHATPEETVQVSVVLEEAAQSAIYASSIGGATVIPPPMVAASRQRAADFRDRDRANTT